MTTLSLMLATLTASAALPDPAPVAPSKAVMVTVVPHAVPFGLQGRVHVPVGSYTAVMFGAGGARAMFDVGDGTVPLRLRAEVGVDHYFGDRFQSFFVGSRAQVSYWTAPPVIGGSNASIGPVAGGRWPIGDRGGSVGFAAGAVVKQYVDYRLFEGTDGTQILPTAELEVSFPTRPR
jgi:hypothetical protein